MANGGNTGLISLNQGKVAENCGGLAISLDSQKQTNYLDSHHEPATEMMDTDAHGKYVKISAFLVKNNITNAC